MPRHGARADGLHHRVRDVLAHLDRLEFRIEQVLGAGEDQRFGLIEASALAVSPSNPGVVPTSCRS